MKLLIEKSLNEVSIFDKKKEKTSPSNKTQNKPNDNEIDVYGILNSNPILNTKRDLYKKLIKISDNPNYLNYLSQLKYKIKSDNCNILISDAFNNYIIKGDEKWLRRSSQHEVILDTILSLIKANAISGREEWLNSKSLFTEEPFEIAFKIKAIAFVQKKSNLSGYEELSIKDLINKDGEFINAKEMRNHLEEINQRAKDKQKQQQLDDQAKKEQEKEAKKIEKEGDYGINVLKAYLKNNGEEKFNREILHNYLKDLCKDEGMKVITNQLIDSGRLDKKIDDQVLAKSHKSNIGIEPIELVNDDIIEIIKDETNKALQGK